MRAEQAGEVGHAEGHDAGVAQADAALLLAGVLVLADRRHASLGVEQQPAVAGGIGAPRSRARRCRRRRRARPPAGAAWPPRPAACRRTARSRRPGAAPAPAARRAAHRRCRPASPARTPRCPARRVSASARTASMPGATTTASRVAPAARAVASTCASIERPAMACSTFGTRRPHAHALAGGENDDQEGLGGHVGCPGDGWCCSRSRLPTIASQLACRQGYSGPTRGAGCATQRNPRSDAPIAQPLLRRQCSPVRQQERPLQHRFQPRHPPDGARGSPRRLANPVATSTPPRSNSNTLGIAMSVTLRRIAFQTKALARQRCNLGATTYGTSSTCPQPGWLLQGVLVDRPPPTLTRLGHDSSSRPVQRPRNELGCKVEPVVLKSEDAPGHVGSGSSAP